MNDMSFIIDQDITIMSIFELQDVGNDTISCKRTLESILSRLICVRFRAAEGLYEMVF